MTLKQRYGPVALVAGASEGIGAAFARKLASEGLDLVIVARRRPNLESMAAELSGAYGVNVLPVTCDLSSADAMEKIRTAMGEVKVNFLVYNAALCFIGPFLSNPMEQNLQIAGTNMITPLKMLHDIGGKMVQDKRGGIVLMSSLAGNQGSGFLAAYAASKAFNRILAESLWYEWKDRGVDVIGCCAGATLTPGYIHSNPGRTGLFAPSPQQPSEVVNECFRRIGKYPSFISGGSNKIASFVLNHLISQKQAIRLMGDTTKRMYTISDNQQP